MTRIFNKKFLILFALILALSVPEACWADGVTVSDDAGLRAALAAGSGDITLTGNITLTSEITISTDKKIIGDNHKITAASGKRHFIIQDGGKPTFTNLTFEGVSSNGGGIEIASTAGEVTFDTVTFSNNKSTSDGGAIYLNSGATVTFNNAATFTGNSAVNGGAIHVNNSSGKIIFNNAATFNSNTATASGGAIYSQGEITFTGAATFGATTANTAASDGGAIYSSGALTFSSTAAFSNNSSSGGRGGAIYLDSTASIPAFSSTASFTSNTASSGGGAIYVSATSSALNLSGSYTFTSNKATGTTASGGAVYSAGAVTVSGATFNTNTATGSGGAIYSGGNVTVSTGTFTSSSAGVNGGAICTTGTFTSSTSGGTFTTNTATGNGGAVYSGGNVTVSAGTFSNNSATVNGGIIATAGSTINISGGTFDGNTIATVNAVNGGAIYASESASAMTVSGGTFANNTASGSGGAIYSEGTVTLSGGDFTTANAANSTTPTSQGGGAVYADKIIVNGSSSSPLEFSNQTSTGSGGALFAKTSLTASQAIFEKNSAYSGGAMRVLSSGTLTLNNVSFVGNDTTTATTGVDGGAIYTNASTNTLQYCFFKENLAAKDGGAIASGQDNSIFNIAYSYFLDNGAGVAGSTHSQGGGAMYLSPVGTATVNSCTFSGNYVNHTDSSLGGALFIANSAAVVMENSTFYSNKAMTASVNDGGAVYLSGTGEVTVKFCTFTANSAQGASEAGRGGALFVNSGILNIIGSIVADNNTGGDIYNGGGTITSAGYNRIGRLAAGSGSNSGYINWDSNNVGTNAGNDIADNGGSRGWSFSNFFGENTLTGDNGGQRAGAGSDAAYSAIVPTIALDESDPTDTRALDGARSLANNVKIPNGSYPEYDERHLGTVKRASMGAAPDIGAFELYQSSSGGDSDNPYAKYTIKSIKISGIPNTLSIVGHAAVLHATVTYVNGDTTTTDEPLTWTCDDSTVAVIDDASAGSIHAVGIGTANVKVTARSGAYSDSKKIYVIWDMSESNIHADVKNMLLELNTQLAQDDILFLLAEDEEAERVNDSAFQSNFENEFGTKPTLIAYGQNSSLNNNLSLSKSAQGNFNNALTAGVKMKVNNQPKGAVLPVKCKWTFETAELANRLGTTEAEMDNMSSSAFSKWLLEKINVGFFVEGGKFLPAALSSSESDLQNAETSELNDNLVTADSALDSGALSVTRDNGDVSVSMLAYVANVAPSGSSGSKLVSSSNKKLLVIQGGSSSNNIDGTIWTASTETATPQNPASNPTHSGGGGGGGGGGCNMAGVTSTLILLASAVLLNNKRRA